MLEGIFLTVVNMSIIGSLAIILILAVRLLLLKAPKVFSYCLWAVVLFRLLVPFSFDSVVSLIPINKQPVPLNLVSMQTPAINTGITRVDEAVSSALPSATNVDGTSLLPQMVTIMESIWLAVMLAMVVYGLYSLFKLKHKLSSALFIEGNIYQSEYVDTPFVLGIIKPKIYLPEGLNDIEREYILLHEQNHIHRGDHIIRIISYLALCIHWFNPLVWVAFKISGKDMEMANDESVIRKKGDSIKKAYSTSLLALSTGKRGVSPVPLAFGEEDPKGRIKNIINYKQPMAWIIAAALIIVIGVSAGLLMNAASNSPTEKPVGILTYINADNQKVTEDIRWNSYYWQVRDEETGELSYKKMGTEALYPVGDLDTVTPGGAAQITFTLEGKVEPDGIYVYKFNNQEFIQGILNNSNPKAEEVVYTTEKKGGNKTITFKATPGYRHTIGVMYGESWVMYVFYMPPEAEPDTTVELGHLYLYGDANASVFSFEPVEWIGANQTERISELGLDPDDDLPDGFYIYIPPVERTALQVTDNTRYFIIDSGKKPASEFGYKEVGKQEFLLYQDRTPSFASVTPYWVEVEDGYVKVIAQQYLP